MLRKIQGIERKKLKLNQIFKGMKRKSLRDIPLVLRAEKEGVKGYKRNNIPGKYLIGYKLASKMKRQLKIFFIEHCYGTAKESRISFYKNFHVDWDNPYTLSW